MWAFYAASFLIGLISSQAPSIFDSKEYTRETSCMWPWAKQIGTPDNLKGQLFENNLLHFGTYAIVYTKYMLTWEQALYESTSMFNRFPHF